ncbi:ribosomal L7Ae/L30e/S12e/Gadd45 family protein [Anaerotalea alkaliphila]|uniref:50S ribosomal protein L7Ae-like protein n=1 Tax=Anaerotalea alkaliphila TaxID=2662126 RepID=A0A7X5KPH1_9FIRM|nr:ribosomal L7Ae/L30e/S12e/Gadd45 family protein [Anaerotalea alkaliphila]NDL68102.1 50S ribosomal protein L7Ae-like protein [Anaerotalea alkaliphila]
MHSLKAGSRVVGTKQTLRALEKTKAAEVYVAKDAQQQVTFRVLEMAKEQGIPVVYLETMEELAKACDVEVKTATAALIK